MSGKIRRVLVADDEEEMRILIGAVLEREGIAVEFACDGLEALESIERDPPDLVLLDHRMPKLTGLATLERLRGKLDTVHIPVILVTSGDDVQTRVMGLESGANDFIGKPFALAELIVRVRRHLEMVESKRALEDERRKQQERVKLLLAAAALAAGEPDPGQLHAKLDAALRETLSVRMASLWSLEDRLQLVYPPGSPFDAGEVTDHLGTSLGHWASQGASIPPEPAEPGSEPSAGTPSDPGFLSAISHPAGDLWFPIYTARGVVGVAGYSSTGAGPEWVTAEPGLRSMLFAISRLVGMAGEIRDLLRRERTLIAQESEVKSATMMQERVLKDRLPLVHGLDTAAVTLPARAMGGDYYCYFRFRDGSPGAFVADVVGKGLTAAMHTMVLNTLVREHGPDEEGPRSLLLKLNQVMHRHLDWAAEDPVPCTAVKFFDDAGNYGIQIANAGHEPPLHLPANAPAAFHDAGPSHPLGWDVRPLITETSLPLSDGDTLLLYSDGLLDLLGQHGRRDTPVGPEQLRSWLALESSPIAALAIRRLVEIVRRAPALLDDITLMVLRAGSRLPLDGHATFRHPGRLEMFVRSSPFHISPVRAEILAFLEAEGVEAEAAFQIAAVAVEIQTNSIVHGYRGQTDQPMRIGLTASPSGVTLEVEEFHSGGWRPPSLPVAREPSERGGMGLALARTVMNEVEVVTTERISLRTQMRWRPAVTASPKDTR